MVCGIGVTSIEDRLKYLNAKLFNGTKGIYPYKTLDYKYPFQLYLMQWQGCNNIGFEIAKRLNITETEEEPESIIYLDDLIIIYEYFCQLLDFDNESVWKGGYDAIASWHQMKEQILTNTKTLRKLIAFLEAVTDNNEENPEYEFVFYMYN